MNYRQEHQGVHPVRGRKIGKVARGLGLFSIGLGVAEVVIPQKLSRFIGVGANKPLMGGLGAREITSGVGILARPRSASWMWSRVVGDAMDIALLLGAIGSRRTRLGRLLPATAAVAGVTALDVWCSRKLCGAKAFSH